MAENAAPIIIKKKKAGGHGGHHGGSWKVAYADFVTAMMAFFLLLWLLNVSNDEILLGISAFFNNPSVVHAAGGASTSMIKIGKNVDSSKGQGDMQRQSDTLESGSPQSEDIEMSKLQQLKEELEFTIDNTPELAKFRDQLLLDITAEGLRIQLVDKKNRPMFDLSSAIMKPYAKQILRKFAPILNQVKNSISISGHTDARKYFSKGGYGNWELSADRANAARRELAGASYDTKKITRVAGLAAKVLYDTDNPLNPVNRRISIVVLKRAISNTIDEREGADAGIGLSSGDVIPGPLQEAIKEGRFPTEAQQVEEDRRKAKEARTQQTPKNSNANDNRSGSIIRF